MHYMFGKLRPLQINHVYDNFRPHGILYFYAARLRKGPRFEGLNVTGRAKENVTKRAKMRLANSKVVSDHSVVNL